MTNLAEREYQEKLIAIRGLLGQMVSETIVLIQDFNVASIGELFLEYPARIMVAISAVEVRFDKLREEAMAETEEKVPF